VCTISSEKMASKINPWLWWWIQDLQSGVFGRFLFGNSRYSKVVFSLLQFNVVGELFKSKSFTHLAWK
jgi:hypothetical protein